MTVLGRLGTLFVITGGGALLFIEGLQSSPSLWYAVGSIILGTAMILSTSIWSTSSQRRQATSEPKSPRIADASEATSTTQQTDPTPTTPNQTAQTTASVERRAESASGTESNPSPSSSVGKSESTSIAVEDREHCSAETRSTQRPTTNTSAVWTTRTVNRWTDRQSDIGSTATLNRTHSTRATRPYFTPVDANSTINFVQVDTRFSYIDVDVGAEFIGVDLIPDLVEINVGPSAVSYELVRSPIEINLSSILTTLLAPTPRRSNRAGSADSMQPSRPVGNHTRQQVDETATEPRSTSHEPIEHGSHHQEGRLNHDPERLPAADRRRKPPTSSPQSSNAEPDIDRSSTTATNNHRIDKERRQDAFVWTTDRDTRNWGLESTQDPIEPGELGVAETSAIDVGVNHSSHGTELSQWDTDPFGLTDVDPEFSEFDESVSEPLEQVRLGRTNTDWEPGIVDEEPVSDLEIGTEGLGFEEFAECAEAMDGLPSLDIEPGSNPLFPETESNFTDDHTMDDWLTF